MKEKMLIISHGLYLNTGLSNQISKIITVLLERYDVIFCSTVKQNIDNISNVRIINLENDIELQLLQLKQIYNEFKFKYIFTTLDIFFLYSVYLLRLDIYFVWIAYIPIDGEPFYKTINMNILNKGQYSNININCLEILNKINEKVVFNEFGYNVLNNVNHKSKIIEPGIDCDFWVENKINKDKIRFIFVAQNQVRKRFDILLHSWKIFENNNNNNDYELFIITNELISKSGFNLPIIINNLGLKKIVITTNNSSYHEYKELFDKSDCLINCSSMEGFGIPILEAKANSKITIIPNYNGCGIFKQGIKLNYSCVINTSLTQRNEYIINQNTLYKEIQNVYNLIKKNDNKILIMKSKNREESMMFDWSIILKKWNDFFDYIKKNYK